MQSELITKIKGIKSQCLKFKPYLEIKEGIYDPVAESYIPVLWNVADLILKVEGQKESILPLAQELYAMTGIRPSIEKKKIPIQTIERRIKQEIKEDLVDKPYIIQALDLNNPNITEEFIKTKYIDSLSKELIMKITVPTRLFAFYHFDKEFMRILRLYSL